jgi:FtsZ-binding cell division protein ZapB
MYRKTILFGTLALLWSCEDPKPLKVEIQKLNTENARLQKEVTDLKTSYIQLQQDNNKLSTARDTLTVRLKKQEDLVKLEQKARETPLELTNLVVQNENAKGEILHATNPFKKKDVRYLCFNLKAQNNVAKLGNSLKGKLYAVYRMGSLVQRMTDAGTFKTDEGKKIVYTTAWEIDNKDKNLIMDKGIGDKSSGIFEKGTWVLELWFEEKNKGDAYKLAATGFVIN